MPHDPISTKTGTPGGQPSEQVEDRPNVGTVTPEDYPEKDRAKGISDPPLDEEKEQAVESRQRRKDASRAWQPT